RCCESNRRKWRWDPPPTLRYGRGQAHLGRRFWQGSRYTERPRAGINKPESYGQASYSRRAADLGHDSHQRREKRGAADHGGEPADGRRNCAAESTRRARHSNHPQADYELVKTMRASTLVLGPLLARTGSARVSLPGGCAIGARPIDLHLKGLEKLGATLRQEHGYVIAEAKRLQGNHYTFDKITVTGTEDVLMAAVLARGETVLNNCALEPEVVDLAALLVKMGARIEGAGTPTIRVQGVEQLGGANHSIIADRIETGTFVIAALITGGALRLTHCQPEHLQSLIERLEQAGASITCGEQTLTVAA